MVLVLVLVLALVLVQEWLFVDRHIAFEGDNISSGILISRLVWLLILVLPLALAIFLNGSSSASRSMDGTCSRRTLVHRELPPLLRLALFVQGDQASWRREGAVRMLYARSQLSCPR